MKHRHWLTRLRHNLIYPVLDSKSVEPEIVWIGLFWGTCGLLLLCELLWDLSPWDLLL